MKTYHLTGHAPYYTNCYMITDDKGNAVAVDCSRDIEKMKKILENDSAALKAVILTHGHRDHRETLRQAAERFDCPVYLGKGDARLFRLENTKNLPDEGVLEFGDIKFYCFSTPGHTPGGFCLICRDMLFCGDTLFAGTVGRTDLEGGDMPTLKDSLAKIVRVRDSKPGVDLKVLPGHSRFSTMETEKKQNPYLKNIIL